MKKQIANKNKQSKIQRNCVAIFYEWGEDFPPMKWSDVMKELSNSYDWRLPHYEKFSEAKRAGLSDFKAPKSSYWSSNGKGDAVEIVPSNPSGGSICNSYEIKHRFRPIRRIGTALVTMKNKIRSKPKFDVLLFDQSESGCGG